MGRHSGKALERILHERIRQMGLHGVDEHSPEQWIPILYNEVTVFCGVARASNREGMREEAVRVAAIAVAIFESIERGTT